MSDLINMKGGGGTGSGFELGSPSAWGFGGDTLNLGGATSATSGTTNAAGGGGLTPASLATPSVFNPSGNEAFGMANWGGFMPRSELESYLQNPTQAQGSTGSTTATTGLTGSTPATGGINISGNGALALGSGAGK